MVSEMGRSRPDTAVVRRLRERVAALEDSARAHVISNEFDHILSTEGAQGLNATTSHEATRYFVELPANRIELWFALESDRMANPVFREFFTELDVVKEERRMRLETSPGGILETAFLATAFQVHPYGVPVIGHAADLDALTRPQALEYFRDYYGAGNAVAAIVGDVDADQVIRLAEEYFAPVPAGGGRRPPPLGGGGGRVDPSRGSGASSARLLVPISSVPLKSMCSTTWAIPVLPRRSLTDPTG